MRAILEFVRAAGAMRNKPGNTVLFIDTPITERTVEAVQKLKMEGYRVVFRDHHGVEGDLVTDRDRQVATASAKLKLLLGPDCLISVRRVHPACSGLVEVGEFQDAVAIVADPDADGLTAAMKASGLYYPGLDEDAAKLDGEPALHLTGTPYSQLLTKGLSTLPSYDASLPDQRERAQKRLFSLWVAMVEGDAKAAAALESGVAAWDAAVNVSRQLSSTACEIAKGAVLVDVTDSPIFDAATLIGLLEQMPGCRITILRKSNGPIAALHRIQYSLAVAKAYQKEIDLRSLLPQQFKSDPKLGIISNVSFLLHVSDDVFAAHVLPALRRAEMS